MSQWHSNQQCIPWALWTVVQNLNWQVMNPLIDQVLITCFIPLWCHMSNTSESSKVQTAVILLDESLNFATVNPSDPWLNYVPSEFPKPSDGSKSWNGTICVSWEEKHLNVGLMLHHSVNPKWSFILFLPVCIHDIVAIKPCTVRVEIKWVINMQNVLNFLPIEIVRNSASKNVIILKHLFVGLPTILKPFTNVFWKRVSSLVCCLPSIFQNSLSVFWIFERSTPKVVSTLWTKCSFSSVKIIPIQMVG